MSIQFPGKEGNQRVHAWLDNAWYLLLKNIVQQMYMSYIQTVFTSLCRIGTSDKLDFRSLCSMTNIKSFFNHRSHLSSTQHFPKQFLFLPYTENAPYIHVLIYLYNHNVKLMEFDIFAVTYRMLKGSGKFWCR